jgi:hypothetical protein
MADLHGIISSLESAKGAIYGVEPVVEAGTSNKIIDKSDDEIRSLFLTFN